MKSTLFLICMALLLNSQCLYAQENPAIAEIKKFQEELNQEYSNPETSPLEPDDRTAFKGHDFFDINLKFRLLAKLHHQEGPFFDMKTSSGKTKLYRVYGTIQFNIDEQVLSIPVYQSKDLMNNPEYSDHLFLPFTDLTSGETSYGAGRYLGLRIPASGNEVLVDFNQAYNPYCAYSKRYSCPIVPPENDIPVRIEAGVRLIGK